MRTPFKALALVTACTLGAVTACTERGKDIAGPAMQPRPVSFDIVGGGTGDWVTAHNETGANSSFLTINAPAVAEGDLLIAQITISKDFNASDVICAPSGWVSLTKNNFEQKVVQEIFYYVAPADAAATDHTWHFKTSAAACGASGSEQTGIGATGGIIRYGGVDPWIPISAFATQIAINSVTTATAPSVTSSTPDALVLRLFSAFKNLTFADVAGSQIYSAGSSNNSSERTAAAYQALQATPGATGTFDAPMSTSAEWVSATLVMRPAAKVTVNKVVVPASDEGVFDLQINGVTYADDVGDGGTTGAIVVPTTANVVVGELAGDGTSLDDYITAISCDSEKGSDDGTSLTFAISSGEDVTCTITNTRKTKITVKKLLDPTNDAGRFDLLVGTTTVFAGAGHQDEGTLTVTPGTHTVSETAVAPATLSDYTAVIGGDCAADGSVTLTVGQHKTCTITNTRKATLTVTKLLSPTSDLGKFNLKVGATTVLADAGHNGSVAVKLAPNTYTVSETAGAGTTMSNYNAVIGGACAANGSITLVAGQNATCTITNTRKETLLYLHNNPTPPTANTAAQANLPLNATVPTASTLFNYATTYDSNTGVTGRFMDKISSGSALSTTDLQKFQTWRTGVLGADLVINGDVGLRIWAKMKASGKAIQLRAYMRSCTGTTEATCTTIATANMSAVANAPTTFTEYTLTFTGVNSTVLAANRLQLRVVALDVSNSDPLYLAYDTTVYPARLIIP